MSNDEQTGIDEQAADIVGASPHPRNKPEKRTSRACLTCRKRKSQCLLPTVDGVVTTPCKRCESTGQECIIGSSNRGGRRIRKRKLDPLEEESFVDATDAIDDTFEPFPITPGADLSAPYAPAVLLDPALQQTSTQDPNNCDGGGARMNLTRESSTGSNIAFDQLQNPSDALGILAQIASHDGDAGYTHLRADHTRSQYDLIKTQKLSMSQVAYLLDRYKRIYHPYFPIVPASTLDAARLPETANTEPVLLTAILVVASRDLVDEPQIFTTCTEHMRALVSDLSAGGPCDVSAVEALLLLAEWTPYTSRSDAGNVGRGEEDREAWMHVGIALRIAYFLGLDRYSFCVRDDPKDSQSQRRRLTWTACYISDRQISIRLGRAFWSRGPGPLTTLRKEDFPMLAPLATGGEDYASIFQATLELTMLFSNVHDVLYSNPGNSMRSHLSGGYIKYIDDFRTAIYGWKSVWGGLTCSPALKATLLISYDFLRLYTCAFGFHATIKRAVSQPEPPGLGRPARTSAGRIFYNNVGAVGDARFIYEGLDAAKSLLSMINTFVDPEQSLRYMPLRFYLYSIYSGVFLYRARCVGALSTEEEQSVRAMVQETISRLERAGFGNQHPGSRYSRLLRLLWDKVERKDRKSHHMATLQNPYRPGSESSTGMNDSSPAVTEVIGEFSWTDLEAVGRFVVNGNSGLEATEADWWSSFLPADPNSFLYSNMPDLDGWDPGVI
ncbi:hypothetical protein AMS68_000906 [Peltaster fructicola]|uniref:Zn(2)-C6 fungal-type domain-containing protein n=1 Tax=Peltaster fructicola TaxID=286661 RepID=A0A6H0XL85_9PEZI|nr:hypothetical protein AMS68_000906 [Peltaster fructicola]